MNATHTPGPWHVTAGQKHILSNDDQIVADVRGIFKPPLTSDTPTGQRRQHLAEDYQASETEANARLIAAAPEMRTILANIVDERDRAVLGCDPAYYWVDGAIETARALLARIDGGLDNL